jgi:hypothetical protein
MAGAIYALISTTLIASFLWIGITRVREKGILRDHWDGKQRHDNTETA